MGGSRVRLVQKFSLSYQMHSSASTHFLSFFAFSGFRAVAPFSNFPFRGVLKRLREKSMLERNPVSFLSQQATEELNRIRSYHRRAVFFHLFGLLRSLVLDSSKTLEK